MGKQFFGTDGIRGRVGVYPIVPDMLVKLGYAIGCYLQEKSPSIINSVLIGKDPRLSGYMVEVALQAGLTAAGVNVKLLGLMPTPGIAFLTRDLGVGLGIVISASHNHYQDNGIKLFNSHGRKLSEDDERTIEALMDQPIGCVTPHNLGKVVRVDAAISSYVNFCKRTMSRDFSLAGKRIVLDCANGATYTAAPEVFSHFGADVQAIGVSPTGLNINENLGSTSPEKLQMYVSKSGADMGVAFDGDGDRVIFVASNGDIVDGDQLLYILTKALEPTDEGYQGIVGTLMTNMGVELALKKRGFEFLRTEVGDSYVKAKMSEKQWLLGGESSGHIICADATTTGDGIIAALKVLNVLSELNISLSEALNEVTLFPQKMISIKVADQEATLNAPMVKAAIAKSQGILADKGRVLVRASGTEPVIRIMVEASQLSLVNQHLTLLYDAVEKAENL